MTFEQAEQKYIAMYVERALEEVDERLYSTDSDSGYSYLNSRGEDYAQKFELEAASSWKEAVALYNASITAHELAGSNEYDFTRDFAYAQIADGKWDFPELLADLIDEAYHETV